VNKYILIFFLLASALSVFGQKKSIVNLIKSENSTGFKINGKDVIKVYQGTFKQDFSILSSDSAYFYPEANAFDAFGHVVIDQGDTLHIYSDKLNYNGNTKTAILTDNVKMVDKDATLTTNHLTYNTATRIGTYTEGGKLVNRENTLISKNGYYFAYSRDSYFRYNVSLKTPDVLVITDTMRYNTGTRISYFYGPTNIYGIKDEKDKDTLYTENGTYNTKVEQAAFGQNNLYKSGTKSLKGDSLYYDKLKGYGRAVKHVTFDDREQKVTIKGDLGTYFKDDEHTIMTQDPYVIIVTEQKDTTNTDSVARADSLKKMSATKKSIMNMASVVKNTIPIKTNIATITKKMPQAKIDSTLTKIAQNNNVTKSNVAAKVDSLVGKNTVLKTKVDSLVSKNTILKTKVDSALKAPPKKIAVKKPGTRKKDKPGVKPVNDTKIIAAKPALKDTGKMKIDSVYMSADTIETRILMYKDLKVYLEKQRLAHLIDTSPKPKKPKRKDEKESKFLTGSYVASFSVDTSFYRKDFFGKPKPVYKKKKAVKPPTKEQLAQDSIAKKMTADSIVMAKLNEPKDTARIRIIIAYHHSKLFKSDLQAKADSMFYSNADSTIRCFVNPIMWTEGSQLTGDTVFLQMKHKKMDNLTMFPNGFIVNIEKNDSVHFNQVAGKRIRGFFKDDKLNRMFVEGNAESIYFNRDSGKTTVNGMQRSLSTRIRVDFKDNKAQDLKFLTKPENKYTPILKVKEDDKILKGFIWKPKERPVSKESIIPSYGVKKNAIAGKQTPGSKKGDQTGKNVETASTGDASKADTAKAKPKVKLPHKVIVVY
jgi:lipopolysaccharide export system protein LptA